VAYENLETIFGKEKLHLTGNPVRLSAIPTNNNQAQARKNIGLNPELKTIFIMGGSLGAKTLNDSILAHLEQIENCGYQLFWQVGKYYFDGIDQQLKSMNFSKIHYCDFIQNMADAYCAADIIVSRAGALSVSELCLVGKPVILVPSPNVSEDHQTKNAMALVNKKAAVLINDNKARETLIPTIFELIKEEKLQIELSQNILKMGKVHATKDILHVIESIAKL
jgi:UDP-N-acetylglucosamine--N-acetylmuramyl-(pentapeptide) pyrophosphoryl-undecaprenol N-acetylglucosamine transferase